MLPQHVSRLSLASSRLAFSHSHSVYPRVTGINILLSTSTPTISHQSFTRSLLSSTHRALTTTSRRHSAWSPGPSPPRLPKEDQEIFEKLLQQSTGAFSTPRSVPDIQPQIISKTTTTTTTTVTSAPAPSQISINQSPHPSTPPTPSLPSSTTITTATVPKGEELHPNIRRGAPPEFTGDVNPKTKEAGGPKNEPLRWGSASDWSYNGRATDF